MKTLVIYRRFIDIDSKRVMQTIFGYGNKVLARVDNSDIINVDYEYSVDLYALSESIGNVNYIKMVCTRSKSCLLSLMKGFVNHRSLENDAMFKVLNSILNNL